MSKVTRPDDAHRAGRFLLAVADDDGQQVATILDEASTDRASTLTFMLELAAIARGLAEQQYGPAWRAVLGAALLDLEMHQDEQSEAGDS